MLVFAYAIGGSVAAGLVAVIQLVPAALFAPIGSLLSDLYPRDRMIFFSYLAQALAMAATGAALFIHAPVALVYFLAAVMSSSITLTRPVQGALLPMLAETPEELIAANVAAGTIESVSIFVGPLLTGLLFTALTPGGIFFVMAVIELGGGLMVRRLRFHDAQAARRRTSTTGLMSSLLGGFVIKDREPRLLLAVIATQFVVLGAVDVLFVVLAFRVLHIGRPGTGFLNSAFGAGGVIGSALGVLLIGRKRLTPTLLASAAALGVSLALAGLATRTVVVLLLLLVCGGGRALMDLAGRSLLQRVVPQETLSSAFGALEGLAMAGLALGAVLAPFFMKTLGTRPAFLVIGCLLPAVGLLAWRTLGRLDSKALVPLNRLRVLQSLPLFSGLEAPVLERLALSLVVVEVRAGAVVFRQGDVGDLFYVIDEGRVQVRIHDRALKELGEGDFFGEIALLRRVRRTATIVATTDARLFTLDGDKFVEAVTGETGRRQSADRIVDQRLEEAGASFGAEG
jgi:MFS family permease